MPLWRRRARFLPRLGAKSVAFEYDFVQYLGPVNVILGNSVAFAAGCSNAKKPLLPPCWLERLSSSSMPRCHCGMIAAFTHRARFALVALLLAGICGCNKQPDFESAGVFRFRLEAETDQDQAKAAAAVDKLLVEWFGTPDQPRWPTVAGKTELSNSILSMERLTRAAGPQRSDRKDNHYGLYRELCSNCHGITGDGRGPAAMFLAPYPRDFRPGWFKYKSTKRGSKPTREDLHRLINNGIPGSSMPAFAAIEHGKNGDLEAVIDYVIYLSIRGQVERELLYEAANDEELIDKALEDKAAELFQDIVAQWRDSSEQVVSVTEPTWWADASEKAAAIERGRTIYQGAVAACATCHGKSGGGHGLVRDYDDWTKDGTVRAGVEPSDRKAIKPYLAVGGLKPVPISPRDLRLGVYRGGAEPADIYRRIVQGIEGTPMPAVALKPDNPQGLSEDEVWALVAYILNMKNEANSATDTGTNATTVAASEVAK